MLPRKVISYQPERTYEIPDDLVPVEPRRILLLEDDGLLASSLKELLETKQYLVTIVPNGAAGLQQLLATDFDVIVCDMVMPGFPGDMFYLAVKKTRPHLCNRFVFTTGHRADPKIDAFIRNTKGLMLWKPFQAHELLDAVETVLRKSRGVPPA